MLPRTCFFPALLLPATEQDVKPELRLGAYTWGLLTSARSLSSIGLGGSGPTPPVCPKQPTRLAVRKPGSSQLESNLCFDTVSLKQICFNVKISGPNESVFSSEIACYQKSHDYL